MTALAVIEAKTRGETLSAEELAFMVRGFTDGSIPDYQMAAFLMAIVCRGLNYEETRLMTAAMVDSGKVISLSSIGGTVVDKHSTGGVGDKTTLVLAPLLAAAGVKIAKMSGRGLGHTGGTIDKLESIPGFRTGLTIAEFTRQVEEIGLAVVAQTEELVPADKKIYALREATGTIASLPLIAASVVSKKVAAGAGVLVFDVKVGQGAFAKSREDAKVLADLLFKLGGDFGRRAAVVISDMNQPLGMAVGNALEVKETVETLKGHGPPDLEQLCLTIGASALVLAQVEETAAQATEKLRQTLESGLALAKFSQWVAAQGGQKEVVENPGLLAAPPFIEDILVPELATESQRFIGRIDAYKIGQAASVLGAGRSKPEESIDPAVGLVLQKKVGDGVRSGEPFCRLYAREKDSLGAARSIVSDAIGFGPRPDVIPVVTEIIGVRN